MAKIEKDTFLEWLKEKQKLVKEQAAEHFDSIEEAQLFLAGVDTCFFGIIEQLEAGRFDIEE